MGERTKIRYTNKPKGLITRGINKKINMALALAL
jgi:hypothetical protein